jgi:hypothetical protein
MHNWWSVCHSSLSFGCEESTSQLRSMMRRQVSLASPSLLSSCLAIYLIFSRTIHRCSSVAANRPTQAQTDTHAQANLASIGVVHFEIRLPDSTSKPSPPLPHYLYLPPFSPRLSLPVDFQNTRLSSCTFSSSIPVIVDLETSYCPSTTLLEDERVSLIRSPVARFD